MPVRHTHLEPFLHLAQTKMIRALRSTDLVKLSFSGLRKLPNQAKPRNRIGRDNLSLLDLMPIRYWPSMDGQRQTWVQTQGFKVKGLVSARKRGGPTVWEIDYLVLSSYPPANDMDLLHALILGAGQCGVDRLFLRLAADSPLLDPVRSAGFCFYIREYLYRLDEGDGSTSPDGNPGDNHLSLKSPADEYGIFQLYNSAFPWQVREAEGQTLEEWRGARGCGWGRRGEKEYIFLEGGSVSGWLSATGHRKNGYLDLIVRPEAAANSETLLDAAASLLKRCSTLWCLTSEFQSPISRILEERGFKLVEEYTTAVRQVTEKVKQPSLVPIGVE